jgi:glucose/arabinose dehydrogenase
MNVLRTSRFVVALGAALLPTASPAAVPANFVDELVTASSSPTSVAFTPDGSRILITQKAGSLIVRQGNTNTTAVTIPANQICSNSERGLLGVAVDPEFDAGVGLNHYIYVYYTFERPDTSCVNRVSRWVLEPTTNTVSLASETVLIDNIHSTAGNHNGGDVQFGKDGFLYISVGDGGCDYAGNSGCQGSNDASRDEHVLIGKVLRITKDGNIPASNPFQGAGTARCNVTGSTTPGNKCQETFSRGHRNPFRIAFDPNAPGTRFFVNDVGEGAWEEIDLGTSGADFGWNCREGAHTNNTSGPCNPTPPGMVDPIYEYQHGAQIPGTTSGTNCNSITGGAFVPNGVWPPAYDNTYLFSDYICGWIVRLSGAGPFTAADFGTNLGGTAAVTLLFGPAGTTQALYYTTFSPDELRRVRYAPAGNNPPTAALSALPTSGPSPLLVNFDGSGSSDPDAGNTLTYLWTFGDGTPETSTTTATTSHSYAADGVYTASLRVRDNHFAFSAPVTQQILVGNAPTASQFFSLTPCRLFDTRNPNGPYGGPQLAAGATRSFTATGLCGVPVGAKAIVTNLTIVFPTGVGELRVGASGAPVPDTSAISFSGGQTRANNGIIRLSAGGAFDVFCGLSSGGTQAILDITGYFQ